MTIAPTTCNGKILLARRLGMMQGEVVIRSGRSTVVDTIYQHVLGAKASNKACFVCLRGGGWLGLVEGILGLLRARR